MIDKYIKAGIIAFALFGAGLLAVKWTDDQRIASLNDELKQLRLDMEESRLFSLYVLAQEQNDTFFCSALKAQIDARADRNQELVDRLQRYEDVNVFSTEYFEIKNYFLFKNLELWIYRQKYKQLCDQRETTILYFYHDKEVCPECVVQAGVLDKVRDSCSNVKNFAFPVNTGITLIRSLATKYDIDKTPALVIDGKTFKGLATEEQIMQNIQCVK
jgi:hypothetical protein